MIIELKIKYKRTECFSITEIDDKLLEVCDHHGNRRKADFIARELLPCIERALEDIDDGS